MSGSIHHLLSANLPAIFAVLAALGSAAPGLAGEEILEEIAVKQRAIRSFEAHFEQVQTGGLFLEPETSRGTFSYQSPDLARWEYHSPAKTVLVRGRDAWTSVPGDGQGHGSVEHVSLGRRGSRIFQALGAGGSIDQLRSTFEIRLAVAADPSVPYRLELTPRSDRVARRLSSIDLELDREGGFPTALAYEEAGGGRTELRFTDVKINPELPAERFELAPPPQLPP